MEKIFEGTQEVALGNTRRRLFSSPSWLCSRRSLLLFSSSQFQILFFPLLCLMSCNPGGKNPFLFPIKNAANECHSSSVLLFANHFLKICISPPSGPILNWSWMSRGHCDLLRCRKAFCQEAASAWRISTLTRSVC